MREITSHQTDRFNREHIKIHAINTVGAAEPNREYVVTVGIPPQTSEQEAEIVGEQTLYFQNGSYANSRPNGLTDEALIAILIDRLQGRQRGKSSRQVALAITKLEEAGLWLSASRS